MLSQQDFIKLQPYLNGVKSMDVKIHKSWGKEVREVILEYQDGRTMVGDLNQPSLNFKLKEGLTTVAEYFVRGNYGNPSYRGNCTGRIIRDFLVQYASYYKDPHFIDLMAGSYTSREVAKELGVSYFGADLREGFNVLSDVPPRSADLAWIHPPYLVFEGSKMPQYSGVQYGNEKLAADGSHIHNPKEFTKWLNTIQARVYELLRKGGRLGMLIGPSKYRGKYYDPLVEMDIYGELENVVIKRQFNCVSDSINYKGKFVKIEHEYLIVIKKPDNIIIPCTVVRKREISILQSAKITWKSLITNVVEHLGGRATVDSVLGALKNHPKTKNNSHIREKIRQVLNSFTEEFIRVGNGEYALSGVYQIKQKIA